MVVIELRKDGEVLTTEKVRNHRYFHAYVADICAYARAYGLTLGVDCEAVVTSDIRRNEYELKTLLEA